MRFSISSALTSRFWAGAWRPYTTAGRRPEARSFFAPARLASARGNALSETDFIVCTLISVNGDWWLATRLSPISNHNLIIKHYNLFKMDLVKRQISLV